MYSLDPDAAKAADVKSAFINQAGKYKGKITCAELVVNNEKGSENVAITFVTDDGLKASFFLNMIYQGNQINETNHKIMSAILACLRMRNTGEARKGNVKKWNKDARKEEDVTGLVFPDMANKEIGILVQMEIDKNSTDGFARPIIYIPFEASTELTASEIMNKVARPELLAKAVQYVADKPLIDRRKGGKPAAQQSQPDHDVLDEDIPF